jgi:hypothetical protein
MASITTFSYYILAIIIAILLVKLIRLLDNKVKQSFLPEKQDINVNNQTSISIVDVIDTILEVLCEVDRVSKEDSISSITDNKIKALITDTYNIVISAKFGYCSKIPNLKNNQDRAIYENEWLDNWYKNPSNITKTYSVFSQIKQNFHLLSEVKQENVTDMKLIQDALIKIDRWMMSQTDYDVSILVI